MEARVYILSNDAEYGQILGNWDIRPEQMSDEQFITCAEQSEGARIYSFATFNETFPNGVKLQYSTIRII